MTTAFVCRFCRKRLLYGASLPSTTETLLPFRPRAFVIGARTRIQSTYTVEYRNLNTVSESRWSPSDRSQSTNPPNPLQREHVVHGQYLDGRVAQSPPSGDAEIHVLDDAEYTDPVSLMDKGGRRIYPPLIRELLRLPTAEHGTSKLTNLTEIVSDTVDSALDLSRDGGEANTPSPVTCEIPRPMFRPQGGIDDTDTDLGSPAERLTPSGKAQSQNVAEIASSRRRRVPENSEKERQREQYHLRLSHSLMNRLGTLPRDTTLQFRRWKLQYRLLVRQGTSEVHAEGKTPNGKQLWELDSDQDMRNEWNRLSLTERLDELPKVMLSVLKYCPEKAHRVLSATLDYRLPPYIVLDTLRSVSSFWRSRAQPLDGKDEQGTAKGIVEAFLKVKETFPTLPLEQQTLGFIAQALPRRHLQRFMTLLDIQLSQLSENTALHFARKLAGTIGEASDAFSRRLALEIMEHLATRRPECVNTDKFKSVVTGLLHQDSLEEESQRFDTQDAFSRLWDKGFRPNIINLTGYLDTLCLAGDVKSAITAAKMFQEYGLRFDNRVVDILFRGAKYKLDGSMVDEVIQISKVAKLTKWRVLENAMHSIFFFHAAEARQSDNLAERDQKPFLPMLRIFAKKYQLESLQSLIPESLPLMLTQEISGDGPHSTFTVRKHLWDFERSVVPVVDAYASSFGGKLAQPSSGVLATMLRAYIKSLRQPYELISLWMYFKHQLEAPSPDGYTAARLVREQKSLIHDTFIMEMLKHPGFKRPALEVLGDMLSSKLKGSTSESGHPSPTVFTFTILLDRLAASGEQALASDLLQVMQENGVQANLATMNVRVKRAAMQQNVAKTVEALAELEAHFKPNEFTFKAFGWLKNQERALKTIEEIITKRKQELGPDDRVYFEDPLQSKPEVLQPDTKSANKNTH